MSRDVNKEIDDLKAKRDALERELAQPGISDAERIAIRNHLTAITGEITMVWGGLIPRGAAAVASTSLPAGFVPTQSMTYQRAEMEGVGNIRLKQTVWSIACKHRVSGYVQRMSKTKLVILVVSVDSENIQRFYLELNQQRSSSVSLTLQPAGQCTTSDERMRKLLGAGFKKISNRSLGSDVSNDLTPEDGASDIVSHAESLASAVWPYAHS